MATEQYISYSSRNGGGGGVTTVNGLSGAVVLAAGTGVTITPSGNTLTISSSDLAAAITSINSDTTAAQTLSIGSGSANLSINDAGGGSHVFNLVGASVVEVTSSVLTLTGATNAVLGTGLSIQVKQATTSQAGYLSANDWNTFNSKQAAGSYVTTSEVGAANGVASLDGGGKVPVAQLPNTVMLYLGAWNASTNSPTLADGTGTNGDTYRASVAGTQNLGSGSQTWAVGDLVIYNGSIWQHCPAADGVSSVNSMTGAVVINAISQLSGDGTTSAASGSQSLALTLATVNSNIGTFTKVTVNAKGLVTAATTLSSGDIPNNAANTSGTAANITATSNSTLTTLSALSLPYSQLTGAPSAAKFIATNAGGQSGVSSTQITGWSIANDTASGWNSGGQYYVVPATGYYQIDATVSLDIPSGSPVVGMWAQVFINEGSGFSELMRGNTWSVPATYSSAVSIGSSVSGLMYLPSGTQIEIYVTQNTGSPRTTTGSGAYNHWSIFQVL